MTSLTPRSYTFWFFFLKFQLLKPETSNYFFWELFVTVNLYSVIFNAESNGHNLKVVKRGQICICFRFWNLKPKKVFGKKYSLLVKSTLFLKKWKNPFHTKKYQILSKKYPILAKNTQFLSKNSQSLSKNTQLLPKITQLWPKKPNSWQKIPNSWKTNTPFLWKMPNYCQQIPSVGEKHPIRGSKYPIIVKNTQMLPKKYQTVAKKK